VVCIVDMVGRLLVARLVAIYKWSRSAFSQGSGPTSATCTAVLVPSLILLHPSLRFLVRISQRFPPLSSTLQLNILKLVIRGRRPLSLRKNAAVPPYQQCSSSLSSSCCVSSSSLPTIGSRPPPNLQIQVNRDRQGSMTNGFHLLAVDNININQVLECETCHTNTFIEDRFCVKCERISPHWFD
jgi:hypothetical protein